MFRTTLFLLVTIATSTICLANEPAETQPRPRVYHVGNIVSEAAMKAVVNGRSTSGDWATEYAETTKALVDLRETVESLCCQQAGSLVNVHAPSLSLVVRHDDEGHREIEKLLGQLGAVHGPMIQLEYQLVATVGSEELQAAFGKLTDAEQQRYATLNAKKKLTKAETTELQTLVDRIPGLYFPKEMVRLKPGQRTPLELAVWPATAIARLNTEKQTIDIRIDAINDDIGEAVSFSTFVFSLAEGESARFFHLADGGMTGWRVTAKEVQPGPAEAANRSGCDVFTQRGRWAGGGGGVRKPLTIARRTTLVPSPTTIRGIQSCFEPAEPYHLPLLAACRLRPRLYVESAEILQNDCPGLNFRSQQGLAAHRTRVMRRDDIRNIAIIAHVDHGKTTLVDALLKQSGQFRESELAETCILDSNELERERGITILSKNISMEYKGVKINVIDTPGHSDFGGEVERVLKMADGALMLVDAFEGPRPQTRFVLTKALEVGLQPLIVVNKIDRPDCRPEDALLEAVHLMEELGAKNPLEIPYIFASGRAGYASHDHLARSGNMSPLLDMVLEKIPGPEVDVTAPLQMMVTSLIWSEYVGKISVGRIAQGTARTGQRIAVMKTTGPKVGSIEALETFTKLGRAKTEVVSAGDIVAMIGLPETDIGDTVCDVENQVALPRIEVDEPTLSMVFTINSSPLSGKSGKFLTSRHLRDRLNRELQSNVALRVEDTDSKECFKVSGRGLLHLSILIETMRREGYELSVGKPEVIRKQIDGKWHEPYELLEVESPATDVGSVIEVVSARKGQMTEMRPGTGSHTHLEFTIPARGLIGLRTRLLNATKGEAIMHHRFEGYKLMEGEIPRRKNGVLVSQEAGKATAYALWKLGERADFFVGPGDDIYEGMVVGENARSDDMVVNPIREKKLTNIRSSGADENIILPPPRIMSLEMALEYIEWDEYVEITPAAIRIRKIWLRESDRKRQARA